MYLVVHRWCDARSEGLFRDYERVVQRLGIVEPELILGIPGSPHPRNAYLELSWLGFLNLLVPFGARLCCRSLEGNICLAHLQAPLFDKSLAEQHLNSLIVGRRGLGKCSFYDINAGFHILDKTQIHPPQGLPYADVLCLGGREQAEILRLHITARGLQRQPYERGHRLCNVFVDRVKVLDFNRTVPSSNIAVYEDERRPGPLRLTSPTGELLL